MKYRAEIDGLRAIAVVPVILFHAGFELFSGGFVGVDVFFVISGYLITTILVDDIENNRFSILDFYERRAKRILPVLYFYLLLSSIVVVLYFPPHAIKDFSQSLLATSLFVSNVFFYTESDYFNNLSELAPLLHTWSLAVEEQFYLILPLLLWALYKIQRSYLFIIVLSLTIISFYLSERIVHIDQMLSFYMIYSRFWELSAGVITALLIRNRNRAFPLFYMDVLAYLGISLILVPVVFYSKMTVFPGLSALPPVLGSVMIIMTTSKRNYVFKLLSNRYFVSIGKISYSLYLSHNIVLAVFRNLGYGLSDWYLKVLAIVISLLLAVFSYWYVETPVRKGALSRKSVFVGSVVIGLIFSALGYYGHKSNGLRDYVLSKVDGNYKYLIIDAKKELRRRYRVWKKVLSQSQQPYSTDSHSIKALILGDSKSQDLYVSTVFAKHNDEIEYRQMYLDDTDMNSKYQDNIKLSYVVNSELYSRADVVILSATWQNISNNGVINFVEKIERDGKKVVILSTSNFNDVASLSFVIANRRYDKDKEELYIYENIRDDWQRQYLSLKDGLKSAHTHVLFIEKLFAFCNYKTKRCSLRNNKGMWYIYDSGHFTVEGAKYFGEYFVGLMEHYRNDGSLKNDNIK